MAFMGTPIGSGRGRSASIPVWASWLVLADVVAGGATDVTTCGTTVANGDMAVLQADLDCAKDLFGVRLLTGAMLRLSSTSHGVEAPRVTLADSVVTGNGAGDGASASPPHVSKTTCGTSVDTTTQATWGVCAND